MNGPDGNEYLQYIYICIYITLYYIILYYIILYYIILYYIILYYIVLYYIILYYIILYYRKSMADAETPVRRPRRTPDASLPFVRSG